MELTDKGEIMILISDNKEYDTIIVNPRNTCVVLLGSLFMLIRKER